RGQGEDAALRHLRGLEAVVDGETADAGKAAGEAGEQRVPLGVGESQVLAHPVGERLLAKLGATDLGDVYFPLTTTDFTPYIQQILANWKHTGV
ncbi:hypothetical protein B4Q13_22190, partial [Lacticaseibacillus rhamnosus]